MVRVQNALMGLVGTAGAGAYFAALFFSGALAELTSLPILLMVAVGLAGLCALPIGLTPIYAFIASGGPKAERPKKPKKAKKAKKGKKSAAVASDSSLLDDDDMGDVDDFDESMPEMSTADDIEYSDSFDSEIATDDDFAGRSDMTESGVTDFIDSASSSTGSGEEDPFDISDSFESDVKDIEGTMGESESFDDQFELSPDSGVDFETDDDDEK